jgi:hypothetical protein
MHHEYHDNDRDQKSEMPKAAAKKLPFLLISLLGLN